MTARSIAIAVIRRADGALLVTSAVEPGTAETGTPRTLVRPPGGGIDPGESAADAVARELQEELGLAVTGIAGPDGGSAEKPIGLVWFGLARAGQPVLTEKRQFENLGRDYIRRETVKHALNMGLKALSDQAAGGP